jgi:hypothetical protein
MDTFPCRRPARPGAHRRTGPSVTRKSCAISLISSPRATRSAAPARAAAARRGVPARLHIPHARSYARSQRASQPELYEFSLVKASYGQEEGGFIAYPQSPWPIRLVRLRQLRAVVPITCAGGRKIP